MVKQVWQSEDGKCFDRQEDAETQDIVHNVMILLRNAYFSHGGSTGGFGDISVDNIKIVADIIVNTDVLSKIVDYVKDKKVM